jgi:hypothetical protein
MSLHKINAVEVPGSPSEADSFAACLQAALKQWGREVPYDCVAGFSGTAFSPALDREARCPGLWMEAGADVRVEFLGDAMGFTVERGAGAAFCREGGSDRFARRARAALSHGGVVLCRLKSGWNILNSAGNGAGVYGLVGLAGAGSLDELPPEARVYALRPTERSLTSGEALCAAVEFGARLASGTCATEGVAFGGQIYDAWVNQLTREPFCPGCGENEWRCAERAAGRARGTQLSAVRFLSRACALLEPGATCASLREASHTFAAMADTLAPYGESEFRRVWQDAAERTRYAADVARVRDLHKQAARHLCAAARAL